MSDLLIGACGKKIEFIYKPNPNPNSPIVLLLHPHPQYGGNMQSKTLFYMEKAFLDFGFSTFRFNFRGVGKSSGEYDHGEGELVDASVCLDWLQEKQPRHSALFVAGFSFGAYIGLQLMVRRTEVNYFVSVSTPSALFDISFIHPCPVDGVFIHAEKDDVSSLKSLEKNLAKTFKNPIYDVKLEVVPGANHFLDQDLEKLQSIIGSYIQKYKDKHGL